MSPAVYHCLSLADSVAGGHLQDADLLLFRGRGTVSSSIQIKGRSPYSHAAMAAMLRDVPMCAESREWHGGRLVTLASQVKKYQGQIDVYTANAGERWCEFNREGASSYMMKLAGRDYAYGSVLAAALERLFVYRLFVRNSEAAANWRAEAKVSQGFDGPVYCSMACDLAYRYGGGVDPVQNLESRLTEPGDLARSPFFAYSCTLV